MDRVMLDTNVFNAFLDEDIDGTIFDRRKIIVTHIQFDEISRTKNLERRAQLLAVVEQLQPAKESTSTAVWDDSRWNEAKYSDGRRYNEMCARLKEIERSRAKTKRTKPINRSRDVRIAETALDTRSMLVSNDADLVELSVEYGGVAVSTDELISASIVR